MPRFIFTKRLESAPRKNTKIYSMKVPKVNEKTLLSGARHFQLNGAKSRGQITATRDTLSYSEGGFEYILGRRSGALRFFDRSRWMVDDGKTNIDISDEQAVEQAEKFVKDLKLVPMRECSVKRVSRLKVGSMRKGSRIAKERTIDVGVLFQRTLDNVPVEGPGGKLMVYLDHEGKITCVDKLWRDINRVKRPVPFSELKKPDMAENHLKRIWARNFSPTIEVSDVRFIYYEMGMCDYQRTLQPAYLMPIRILSPVTDAVMKSFHVYPAASKPVGRIIPTKKLRPAEPVRK